MRKASISELGLLFKHNYDCFDPGNVWELINESLCAHARLNGHFPVSWWVDPLNSDGYVVSLILMVMAPVWWSLLILFQDKIKIVFLPFTHLAVKGINGTNCLFFIEVVLEKKPSSFEGPDVN